MPNLSATLTVDDLIFALRRSQKPNLVVEGKDDEGIYGMLVERLGIFDVDFHISGGRQKLLEIYERRSEFAHVPVAFIADQDMWVFSEIPQCYGGIIWTKGYSIENDLYAGAELERLMAPSESLEHRKVLESIVEWFAFEVEEFLAGRNPKVDIHCNQIVPLNQTEISDEFRKSRGLRRPNPELHQQIREAYQLQLRGKHLFDLLLRFLSESNRDTKHSRRALHEIALKMPDFHSLMDRLMQEIKRTIAEQRGMS